MKEPNSYHASSGDSVGYWVSPAGSGCCAAPSAARKAIDWTKPLKTEKGFSARLLHALKPCATVRETHIVLVDIDTGTQCLHYYESGGFLISSSHPFDLVNVEPDRFVNIWATRYPSGNIGNVRLGHAICDTFSEAKTLAAQAINRGDEGVLLATINLKDI